MGEERGLGAGGVKHERSDFISKGNKCIHVLYFTTTTTAHATAAAEAEMANETVEAAE